MVANRVAEDIRKRGIPFKVIKRELKTVGDVKRLTEKLTRKPIPGRR